ncbi:MAG TPA: aminotransferase class IV [Candidatus Polarisedimenticolia bacterium]|nr:aminotransferase class IV [Candidatus Polarisedimenticolia bacterium]
MLVHVDGRLVEEADARISVFDRGLLYGDGVFESMRAVAGRIFRLEAHLERLERSAALAEFDRLPERAVLASHLRALLEANGLLDARLRLTLTRGAGRPGDYVHASGPPTRIITAAPFSGLDPRLYEEGVGLAVVGRQAVPAAVLDAAIKTTSRLSAVLARREAARAGAFEAALLDASGHLTEGTTSNIFLVEAGRLLTPAADGAALPGVTRAVVLEAAHAAGLPVEERPLPAALLFEADEIFLTNTSWEVLPVTRVDGRPAGGGRPGPRSAALLAGYRERVRRECA